MFSLIVTIISVALVAALALATLYYGGDAFNQGAADARAAQIINEGQQLMGAADLFRVNTGQYPRNPQELVSSNYLKSVPVSASGMTLVFASGSEWTMPEERVPVFELTTQSLPTCQRVNKLAYGMDGVLSELRPQLISQCWGPDKDSLRTVYAKGAAELQSVPAYGGVISADPIPAPDAPSGWLERPSEAASTPVIPAALTLDPPALSFGDTQVGERSGFVTVNVSNNGGSPATNVSLTPPAGFEVSGSTCSGTLNASGQCSFQVAFVPGLAQSFSGSELVLSSSESASAARLPLSGTGRAPAATLTSAFFPQTQQGQSSEADAVLSNTGVGPLSLTVPSASSVSGAAFSFVTSNCSTSVAPGDSCLIRLQFAPSSASPSTGSLELSTGAGVLTASLNATGVRAELQVSPTGSQAFGDIQVGLTSTSGQLTVTNVGQAAAQAVSVTAPAGFSLVSNSCDGVTLAAETGTCSFAVRFEPTAYGPYGGAVVVGTSSGQGTFVNVSGQGVGSNPTLQSGSFSVVFPDTPQGAAAPVRSLTLRNDGNSPMTLNVAGVDSANFSVTENTCTGVAPTQSCSISFSMLTASFGLKSDPSYTITGATSGILNGSLSGTVTGVSTIWGSTNFNFGNVSVGQSATTQVAVTNNGNVSANLNPQTALTGALTGFSFSGCASVAPGATCQMTVTFAPTAAGSYSVSVRPSAASTGNTLTLSGSAAANFTASQFSKSAEDYRFYEPFEEGSFFVESVLAFRNDTGQTLTVTQISASAPSGYLVYLYSDVTEISNGTPEGQFTPVGSWTVGPGQNIVASVQEEYNGTQGRLNSITLRLSNGQTLTLNR